MAANYGRPKPVDPVWYRMTRILSVRCGCGHGREVLIGDLVQRHRLPRDMRLYEVIGRMRCEKCGARGPSAEVI